MIGIAILGRQGKGLSPPVMEKYDPVSSQNFQYMLDHAPANPEVNSSQLQLQLLKYRVITSKVPAMSLQVNHD
jgi:hypothetical protein